MVCGLPHGTSQRMASTLQLRMSYDGTASGGVEINQEGLLPVLHVAT